MFAQTPLTRFVVDLLYSLFVASPQQVHNIATSRTTNCTTNPQQIHNESYKWSLSYREFQRC